MDEELKERLQTWVDARITLQLIGRGLLQGSYREADFYETARMQELLWKLEEIKNNA